MGHQMLKVFDNFLVWLRRGHPDFIRALDCWVGGSVIIDFTNGARLSKFRADDVGATIDIAGTTVDIAAYVLDIKAGAEEWKFTGKVLRTSCRLIKRVLRRIVVMREDSIEE
jgi:hypothetical protein